MSRDNQYLKMAKDLCDENSNGICSINGEPCDLKCRQRIPVICLCNKGYRKASEVAREIADFIWEKDIAGTFLPINGRYLSKQEFIEHFEKKYTE